MNMFKILVKEGFSAAHRIELHGGKCEELHGHNYVVEVIVDGGVLNSLGMVMDFTDLKGHLRDVVGGLDHRYLNDIPFFRERTSSAEVIAVYVFEEMKCRLPAGQGFPREVRVWESDTSCAIYSEGG
jgi:6-pyruvoyltetrahydropterin/6-carboxytetrahydropterin synthase